MIEHPYQLRRVELRDFKSVARASVDLRPLTVVVGANSSGKSTLLQSILAVTQAVRTGANTAEFPLNGEFVRLGTFEETRNFQARDDAPMEIAFDLVDSSGTDDPRSAGRAGPRFALRRAVAPDDGDPPLRQMTWRSYVEADGDSSGDGRTVGFARLTGLQIEVASLWPDGDEPYRVLTCDVSELGTSPAVAGDADGDPAPEVVARFGAVPGADRHITAAGRLQDWDSGVSRSVDALVLEGGIPQALLHRVGQFARLASLWWDVATELLGEELHEQRSAGSGRGPAGGAGDQHDPAAVHEARTDISMLAAGGTAEAFAARPMLRGLATPDDLLGTLWSRRLVRLGAQDRKRLAASLVSLGEVRFRDRLREELAADGADWLDQEVLVELGGESGDALRRVAVAALRFFRSSVRYLGPLREAPHVLYDPGPSKVDLGVRGEYAAAVLHAQAARQVLTPAPDGGRGELRPLSEALDLWLGEFGLADQVRSEDRGRIGIGLSVRPPGSRRDVDLTSVGVGVSQLLPVVLLCLLAEPGVLVVLEQPELHLHPRLQQALGDFLLACARSGRQLVVESHSEHLVNRLRYLIARDETDAAHDLIELVFAEQRDGATSYRSPGINRFGGLADDWPDGFLDLNAREAQDLVRESLAKRLREGAIRES